MAEKIDNWNPTCKRFIAFLDIMGFRDRVFRNSHEEVKNMFDSIYPTLESMEKMAKDRAKRGKTDSTTFDSILLGLSSVFPVTFSDSIILFSSDNSYDSTFGILAYVSLIINVAIKKGIPMKGAIAYGDMTADLDKSLYFGRPLIDAFELQGELQLYGVVLHYTIEKFLSDSNYLEHHEGQYVLKYAVPMKSGKITHYLVDWTSLFLTQKNLLDSVTQLYNNVSGTPRLYVDNTLEFVRWLIEEKAKREKQKKP